MGANTFLGCRPALKGLLDFVEDVSNGEVPLLVAHNGLSFDLSIILKSCLRVGLPFPLHWYFLDSLYLARRLFPKRSVGVPGGPKNLKQVRTHCPIPLLSSDALGTT